MKFAKIPPVPAAKTFPNITKWKKDSKYHEKSESMKERKDEKKTGKD